MESRNGKNGKASVVKWVKVTDSLPGYGRRVLICYPNKLKGKLFPKYEYTVTSLQQGGWTIPHSGEKLYPTHWTYIESPDGDCPDKEP
jgi:hypothetical protein